MAPVLPWDDFRSYALDWRQDQHMGAVGPTDQGKTTLLYHLLDERKYVTYLSIKTHDKSLEAYADQGGYERIDEWPPMKRRAGMRARPYTAQEMPRRLLWPDATELDSEINQATQFNKALHDIYAQGGWCTVLDDYWYMAHILKFERTTKKMLANARSNDIPLVIAAQRPSGNRLVELFDQTTHLFFFRDNDEPNLKRISGVGSLSSRAIQGFVSNLEPFQALYINTRRGWMYRTRCPELTLKTRRGHGRSNGVNGRTSRRRAGAR
jgi:hypothetical protein